VQDPLPAGWFERIRPTYAAALTAFVAALEHGTPPPATLQDGLKAQAIAEAATVALRSGRTETIQY
jgi:myo-inositol 2-dehydrogenase/D-chiro-inositol 1-dehydrogenase